jgi:deazaflavin-dependent oxidoreductase (nitroreductase family)
MDIQETNRRVIEQFRAGGEIEGMHRDRLVLLTTVGRKTGRRHTRPMMFHRDGDRILVVAANAGAPTDPDWYRNLLHEPAVSVEVGDETYEAVASVLTGADREGQWATLTSAYPFLAEYEVKAGRTIPVVALGRRA